MRLGTNAIEFVSKYGKFHSINCIWKCRTQNTTILCRSPGVTGDCGYHGPLQLTDKMFYNIDLANSRRLRDWLLESS